MTKCLVAMSEPFDSGSSPQDGRTHQVVVNDEGQFSIWLVQRALPAGWYRVGPQRTKEHCLAFIAKAWTDITPRSARRFTWSEVVRDRVTHVPGPETPTTAEKRGV